MTLHYLTRIAAAALSLLVSLVALRMAMKGLRAARWLPFQEAAAGVAWTSLPERQRALLLFLVRMSGLGFFALFLLLASLPPYLAWRPDPVTGAVVDLVGVAYSLGLAVLNHRLHRDTGANTPWRGALGAAGLLALAAALFAMAG